MSKQLKSLQSKKALLCLDSVQINEHDIGWKFYYALQIINENLYSFNELKSKRASKLTLEQITFNVSKQQIKEAKKAIVEGQALIEGINLTRNLSNLPANYCTPSFLAKEAQALGAKSNALKVTVLEEKQLKKLGLNALVAVSQGSIEPPKLITIEYAGTKQNKQPIVLVGKGITFDSGGLFLKPCEGIVDMKFDMCGAATVLGLMLALTLLKLPLNVVGVIACAENMPSGSAVKPGDVIKTLSGLTVEINNTDAEGRLVLCDALTYCQRFNPKVIVDIATLTGAIVVALGPYASGLFSNDEQLVEELKKAALESEDYLWQMPLIQEYQDKLKSAVADMTNVSQDRLAGAIIGACFLSRFTQKNKWAHLDIAGVAYKNNNEGKVSTGRPVPLLLKYLMNQCA